MKLYGTPRSPFARRVRLALLKNGIPFEWVELSLAEIFPPSEKLLKVNPLGLIPVLELEDGECLVDSTEILNHIDATLCPLWPSEMPRKIRARQISMLANGIMTYAVREFQGLRVASPLDGAQESNIELIARVLDRLENELSTKAEIFGNPNPDLRQFNQCVWDLVVALEYLDFRLADKLNWRAGRSNLSILHDKIEFDDEILMTSPK